MEQSIWYKNGAPEYPALENDVTVDAAVIGGGLAGIMCAYELTERGKKVAVIEADRIGRGETEKSSAMLSYAHDVIYSRLIKKHGFETAEDYFKLNKNGLCDIIDIIGREKINCGYTPCDMVLFATTAAGKRALVNENAAYELLGENVQPEDRTELPFKIRYALRIKDQGRLNPYLFVTGLAAVCKDKGTLIFEKTRVTQPPENDRLKVNGHTVTARNFVIATHFPYINIPGLYFAKMFQSRSHNIVFHTRHKLFTDIYESAEANGFEYRAAEDGILCGGAHIRTGKYKYKSQYRIVEKHLTRFDDARPFSRFSAQDCMTFDLLPFAGTYSGFSPQIYLITGFNKWGFTNSAAAAKITADLICGKKIRNPFSPERLYFASAPLKAAKNISELLASFADLLLSSNAKKLKRIKPGQGAVVRFGLKRVGVYRDEKGNYKAVAAVCPHMGCSLKWNKDECTWDCPCHGSRFTPEGDILSSPAVECAKRLKIDK